RRREVAPGPRHVSHPALCGGGCLRRYGAATGKPAASRHRGLWNCRAGLFCALTADHQFWRKSIDYDCRLGGGQSDRVLPDRVRHRGFRRRTAARARRPGPEQHCGLDSRCGADHGGPFFCSRPAAEQLCPGAVERPVTQSTRSTIMNLKGKVAIVTGGNSGIGKAIVLELAKQAANIVIDYVCHPEATEALERQCAALGDQAIGVEADVSKVADLQRLINAAVQKFGHLDIMVNNAGVETRTSVLDTTEEQYERVLQINLKSAFFGTQLAARQMIKQ